AWSRVLDAMYVEGSDYRNQSMAIALRRLTGVQLADRFCDWSMCDIVEDSSVGDSPLNFKQIGGILKQAQHIARFSTYRKSRASSGTNSKKSDRDGGSSTYKGKSTFKKAGGNRDKSSASSASGGNGASQK
ncbi:MAG TPA: hypothetical protein V6C97_17050, partial [Oculatellaceae cyanobacterium]